MRSFFTPFLSIRACVCAKCREGGEKVLRRAPQTRSGIEIAAGDAGVAVLLLFLGGVEVDNAKNREGWANLRGSLLFLCSENMMN